MKEDLTPDFSTPDRIQNVAEEIQKFENRRALDRAIIDDTFNGVPPFTPEEATRLRVEVNVNWNDGGKILDDANRQVDSALIYKPRVAVLTLLKGQVEERSIRSEIATELFNDTLMRGDSGRSHLFLLKSRNHSMTLHGIGPLMWGTSFNPAPRFVPLSDLLIPTDTDCAHENLCYFAVNLYLSQGELLDMVGDEDMENGWNKKAVYQVLHWLQNIANKYTDPCDPVEQPEKWAEYRKQNRGFFYASNDEVPKVQLRAFFYADPSTGKWYRKVLLRFDAYNGTNFMENVKGGFTRINLDATKVFLYDSKEPFADKLSEILHLQYGDISRVPPLKHHSVRGLGVSLFGPVECMNRMRCQFVQSVFVNLLTWFRINDPADRDRLKHFVMEQYAMLPAELQIVPAAERYQLDVKVVESAQSQFRQLMNESSASFVRDIEGSSQKEMTLGEAQIRLQQVNVQVSGMLKSIYAQEIFLYEEVFRRYLLKGRPDENSVGAQFKKACIAKGIPSEFMDDPKAWRVDIEQVLGSGDQTLAQNQANMLLSQKGMLDPKSARIVERDWLVVTTGDPAKARMLVPDAPEKTTSGAIAAQNLFGTLMQGMQVAPREGIDQSGYIEQMLAMMAEKTQMISQIDNIGTQQDVIGLTNVGHDVQAHIQILARDAEAKQQVKKFNDALGELMNLVKAFAQRQQQAAKGAVKESVSINYKDAPPDIQRQMEQAAGFQPSQHPEAQIDPKTMKAVQTAKIKDMQFQQKQRHTEAAFQMEQARENMRAIQGLSTEEAKQRQALAFDSVQRALEALQKAEEPASNGSHAE